MRQSATSGTWRPLFRSCRSGNGSCCSPSPCRLPPPISGPAHRRRRHRTPGTFRSSRKASGPGHRQRHRRTPGRSGPPRKLALGAEEEEGGRGTTHRVPVLGGVGHRASRDGRQRVRRRVHGATPRLAAAGALRAGKAPHRSDLGADLQQRQQDHVQPLHPCKQLYPDLSSSLFRAFGGLRRFVAPTYIRTICRPPTYI
jgi:hypothetical protein